MATRLRYPELAPEGIATMRATEHYLNTATALPAVLLELVRLRVSLRNGCGVCIAHHQGELRKHHEPDSRIQALEDWVASDAFTQKERAALAWADSVTDIQATHAPDADYIAISEFFEGKGLVDLTLAVASINAWNRMSIAFGASLDPHRAEHKAQAEHGAASEEPVSAPQPAAAAASAQARSHAEIPTSQAAPEQHSSLQHDVVDDDGGKIAQD